MYFEENLTYHIYNQGNNKQTIFFESQNYVYFIGKMREYVLPYGDILCYCLMPNHFHILLRVNHVKLKVHESGIEGVTLSPPVHSTATDAVKERLLNDSIAIMLRSYTRAINKQEKRTGSLFREETKAKNGIIDGFVTVDGKHKDLFFGAENDHVSHCFHYIHQNPVAARLVKDAKEWQYSSARDYAGLRNGTLCNQVLAKQMGLTFKH
jgi:putative transposase